MSDKKLAKINNVEIQVNDKKFKLSLKEAEELRDALDAVCPESTRFIRWEPYPSPYIPWVYRDFPEYDHWTTHYCSTNEVDGKETLRLECKSSG